MGMVVPLPDLAGLGARLRAAGHRVVLTNGHFDLLHVGHLRLLQGARDLGDVLVVAVNDDASTRLRKGPTRPIVPAAERAELLAGFGCVDYVTLFGDPTAEAVVALLRPDVYVKGGDYAETAAQEAAGCNPLPEAAAVRAHGGVVRILPLTPGYSTTALARRLGAAFSGSDPEPVSEGAG